MIGSMADLVERSALGARVRRPAVLAWMVAAALVGCGGASSPEDGGSGGADAGGLFDAARDDARVDAASPDDAASMPPDAGPARDAGVLDAAAPDAAVADAFTPSDSGVDAFVPADAGSDAGTDAGVDAGPPPPPTRPSAVVELGDSHCFRDSDRHAWCLRGSPLAPVYVGDADRVFGECALVGDEVRCMGASGTLEPNGQRGVQIAQHSTATHGCVIPSSRDRAVCWFAEGDVWTFTRAMATFVDVAVPVGAGSLPRTANLLFHYSWGSDTVLQTGTGPVGGGTLDLAPRGFGSSFSEAVVSWASNGNALCWRGTGQVRCRTTWNGADGPPVSGVTIADWTRWTAFDTSLICQDDFCWSRGGSPSGGFFGGDLRHVELGEIYVYDAPSTIRGTDLRSPWTVTW